MLGRSTSKFAPPLPLVNGLLIIILVCAAGAAYLWNRDSVFFGGQVFFADGDCYARMTRVSLVEEDLLRPIRSHHFENFPEGTRPHTTAPLDYLIVFLHTLLAPLTENSLSVAGAFISPVIGMLAIVFLGFWSGTAGVAFRWPLLVLFSFSPMTAHAFELGRPDHQSLILAFVASGVASEISLWLRPSMAWRYVSAASWGLALWVSLFEPAVIGALILVARGVRWCVAGRAKRAGPVIYPGPLLVFFGIVIVAIFWEGWPAIGFDPAFARWSRSIGELKSGSVALLCSWVGWMALAAPVLLVWRFILKREAVVLLVLAMVLVTGALTFVHVRWGYFFVLSVAMSLPWALSVARSQAFAGLLFVISLWPVASAWDQTLFPDDATFRARSERLADSLALRDAALQLREKPRRGVIAPWWFSPAVVWWSGQPAVGGSSHQSLPGIRDSARFFLSGGGEAAEGILRARKVGYVIAYEPDRVETNSAELLGEDVPPHAMVRTLFGPPRMVPPFLLPVYGNRFFRVFEVRFGSADFE